jgi:hypothetical protein
MALIVLGVAISAIVANGLLRMYGLRSMPIRYALATTLGYVVFYLLVWIWLAYISRDPEEAGDSSDGDFWTDGVSSTRSGSSRTSSSSPSRPIGGGGRSGGGGASASFGEEPAGETPAPETRSGLLGFFGSEKGSKGRGKSDKDDSRGGGSGGGGPLGPLGALLVFILPLIVIGGVCYYLVSTGPDLLGEIAFQAVLIRAVLGRSVDIGSDTWLHVAFRRTCVPFAIVITVVLIAGWYAESRCPRAATLGEVLRFCGF